jgi:hypothetical protein
VTPRRIQRKRTKGWRMPEGAVYVGRPTKWGNPYVVGCVASRRSFGILTQTTVRNTKMATAYFERWITGDKLVPLSGWNQHRAVPSVDEICAELAGKDLACWCPIGQACHADVLLRIANEAVPS